MKRAHLLLLPLFLYASCFAQITYRQAPQAVEIVPEYDSTYNFSIDDFKSLIGQTKLRMTS